MYYRKCDPLKSRKEPLRKKNEVKKKRKKLEEQKWQERSPQKLTKKKSAGVPKAQDWRSREREYKNPKINKPKIQKRTNMTTKTPKEITQRRRRNLILHKEMITYLPYNRVYFLYIFSLLHKAKYA